MEDPTPSIDTLARAAEASYSQTDVPTDYNRVNELSTPEISTYKHKVQPHYIISHRGTALDDSKTRTKDLRADLKILIGDKSQSQFMKDRTKQTEEIVKKIKQTEPDHKIHLTGHSLGGVSSQTALIKSKVVREGVDTHNTFNAGTSPLKMKELAKSNPSYRKIAMKSVHHKIVGDAISNSVKSNMIGEVRKYKSTVKPNIAQHILDLAKPIAEKSRLGKLAHLGASKILETLQSHSLKNFIK
jgi:hypothetical protein